MTPAETTRAQGPCALIRSSVLVRTTGQTVERRVTPAEMMTQKDRVRIFAKWSYLTSKTFKTQQQQPIINCPSCPHD